MSTKKIVLGVVAVAALGAAYFVFHMPSVADVPLPTGPEAIARGQYVWNAGGCAACHQEEGAEGPSGGHEIENPIGGGKFHVPNITPDKETGIAGWTGKDFLLALKHGRKSSGGFYWAAFPYRSYKDMTDQDALDVGAYLMSLPPINHKVTPHDLPIWMPSWLNSGWNIVADVMEGKPEPVSNDPKVQRGAYLARVLGHCGECHTPRNALGMMQRNHEFEGSTIVSKQIDAGTMSGWTIDDFVYFLETGTTKSDDVVGGEMAKVIEHTKLLNQEDKEAYAAFITRGVGATGATGK